MHQMGALSAEFGGAEGACEGDELEPGGIDAGFNRAGLAPRGERFGHTVVEAESVEAESVEAESVGRREVAVKERRSKKGVISQFTSSDSLIVSFSTVCYQSK
jgi:hypothetical protein